MSDSSELITGTIDDLLLSMAEGLVQAQQQLDSLQTVDAFGRPGPSYQLPYLDFELRIATHLVTDSTLDQRYGDTFAPGTGTRSGGHLLLQTVSPTTHSRSMSANMLSSFKGRFVAVPPNAGRPTLVLRTEVEKPDGQPAIVRASARNTLDEPVAGLEVHFNLDLALSAELSAADSVALSSFQAGTALQHGVVLTDSAGVAQTTLAIDPGEPAGASIAVTVDMAGKTEVLIVTAG